MSNCTSMCNALQVTKYTKLVKQMSAHPFVKTQVVHIHLITSPNSLKNPNSAHLLLLPLLFLRGIGRSSPQHLLPQRSWDLWGQTAVRDGGLERSQERSFLFCCQSTQRRGRQGCSALQRNKVQRLRGSHMTTQKLKRQTFVFGVRVYSLLVLLLLSPVHQTVQFKTDTTQNSPTYSIKLCLMREY